MRKLNKYLNYSILQFAGVITATLMLAMGANQARGRLLGVDVYEGQGSINWSSVHSAGISFAFTKATQGNYYEDPDMAANMNNGKAAGVVMGVYDLADPEKCTPGTEANYFWNYAQNYIVADGRTLLPVLDFEPQTLGETSYIGASSWSDWVNQWCNDVKNLAAAKGLVVTPIIYISAGWTGTYLTSANGWTGAWIADYNGENPQTGSPWDGGSYYQPWGSGVWDFWQYSSSGSVSGISGACDVDVLNGTSLADYLVTSTSSRLDVFTRAPNTHNVWHQYWNGGSWSGFVENIGGVASSDPTCESQAPNKLDVFCLSTDGNLWEQSWNGSSWNSAWHAITTTGDFVGSPGVCSWGPGRVDVVCRRTDGNVWHMSWNTSSWSAWENLGMANGTNTSDPRCVAWGPNRVDVFVTGPNGSNNSIYHKYWGGSSWSGWSSLGGNYAGLAAACSWPPGRIDVFGRGTSGAVFQTSWNGSTWNGPYNIGGTAISGPSATSYTANRIDVFVRGGDNAIWSKYWNGSAWSSWYSIGGTTDSGPGSCSWSHQQ